MTPPCAKGVALVQVSENLPGKPPQASDPPRKPIFDNTEFVTTEGAALFLTKLVGKPFTANAIRLRVHRGQLTAVKPFGAHGGSFYRISELRERFTRSRPKGRR